MPTVEQIEAVLNLWHKGIGATEIAQQFGQNRDWTRRIVRKAAAAGDYRAKPHGRGPKIGAERTGYAPKTRKHYSDLERQKRRHAGRT